MPDLRTFQAAFAARLLGPEPPSPMREAAATVHRNTVALAMRSALAAAYPTVRRLVGDDWFDACAARFVAAHPPRDGILAAYGDGFAAFLASFEPARALPYLPDVARLDRAWTEAHLAEDAPVLGPHAFNGLTPADLLALRLVPHPAARVLRCTGSAYTIWRRHREDAPLDGELDGAPEACLVCRPALEVQWCSVDDAAATFFERCTQGVSIGGIFEETGEAGAAAWPALVMAGAFSRLEAPSAPEPRS